MRRLLALALIAAAILPTVAVDASGRPFAYAFTRSAYSTPSTGELLTREVTIVEGTDLYLYNLSVWGHSLYSERNGPDDRLFWSKQAPFNESRIVHGVPDLAPGTYRFFCFNHQDMKGTLVVLDKEEI